jgi:2-iminobutanoate/2-iminopropanoate deaminase
LKEKLYTQHAPAAIGPYSQAVRAGDTVYVSGQLPVDPATGKIEAEDVTGETRQSLENIKAILHSAGMKMDDVVKTTVFLADMGDFAAMNAVYETYFTDPYPARAAFQVAKLPKDAKVEIEAVASKG